MTSGQRGFLLLTSHFGDPERKCLTVAQFRELAQRVRAAAPQASMREMEISDLRALGYGQRQAEQILCLLSQEGLLDSYLRLGEKQGCAVMTRLSELYPQGLRTRLGLDAPGCLWYKGDASILEQPKVSLVGSRDIRAENAEFAHQVGLQAARQGFTLVSGNARGADRIAQEACLEAGGTVISVLADALSNRRPRERVLYLSEDSFDLPFSALRALSRNRIIHALSCLVLVAQCGEQAGGTWSGTTRNLRHNWSRVCCFDDESESVRLLCQMGAEKIRLSQLADLTTLSQPEPNLFFL